MSRLSVLKKIFLKHRWRLLLTYTLFALEMLGSLLRPFFLGEAVNGLIKGSYEGLIILTAAHLGYILIGTIRHMFDTRTYTAIYTSLVTRMLSRHFDDSEVSKLSAHSGLAREFIDFLEYDLNFIMEACYNLFGSLVLLYFYDHTVVLICLSILIPVSVISYLYGRAMQRLTRSKNDEMERQVDIISTKNVDMIKKHYMNLKGWQIKISDKEALNFGIMEFLVLGVIVVSLLVTAPGSSDKLLAGDLIGVYTYILKFVNGLDTIPYTVQRYSSLKDIAQRIEVEVEEL